MRCKKCGKDLLPEDFRRLRKQRRGMCVACEHLEKYECELRAQERRRERHFALVRECRMRVLPDD